MTGDNREGYAGEQASAPPWVPHPRQDSGALQRVPGERIIAGDWPLGAFPEHCLLSLWGRKSLCCLSCSSFVFFPLSLPCLSLSIPSWLALAPSPHCTPFPLCLPGWRCWVPGVVTVRSGVIIDREAFSPPVLELLLLAEDIGLLNGTADLLVTILDDNDNWPTFSPPALTVHLLENCPPGKQAPGPSPWSPAPGRSCLLVHGDWNLTG